MSTITIKAEINSSDLHIFEVLLKKFKAKKIVIESDDLEHLEDLEDLKAIKERKMEPLFPAKDVFGQIKAKRDEKRAN